MDKPRSNLTIPALLSVILFALLAITQVFNIPLAVIGISGLAFLLAGKRLNLGVLAGLGLLVVTYLIGGSLLCIEALFLVAIPATVMAVCIRNNKSAVYTVVAMMVPFLILTVIYFGVVGETTTYFNKIAPDLRNDFIHMSETMGIQENLKVSDSDMEKMTESYLNIVQKIIRFFPAIILSSMTVVAILGYLLCAYYYKREGKFLLSFPSIDRWKIDERLIVLFGLGMLMVILGSGMISNIGENLTVYIGVIFSFGGLSLLEYGMRSWKFTKFLRVIIYFCVVILNIYSAIILAFVGLLDSHFDYRHVRAAKIG